MRSAAFASKVICTANVAMPTYLSQQPAVCAARARSCAGDWFLLRFMPLTDAFSDGISLIACSEKNEPKTREKQKTPLSFSLVSSTYSMFFFHNKDRRKTT